MSLWVAGVRGQCRLTMSDAFSRITSSALLLLELRPMTCIPMAAAAAASRLPAQIEYIQCIDIEDCIERATYQPRQ